MGITLTELIEAFERSIACRDCKIPLVLVDEQKVGRCEHCWAVSKARQEHMRQEFLQENEEGYFDDSYDDNIKTRAYDHHVNEK